MSRRGYVEEATASKLSISKCYLPGQCDSPRCSSPAHSTDCPWPSCVNHNPWSSTVGRTTLLHWQRTGSCFKGHARWSSCISQQPLAQSSTHPYPTTVMSCPKLCATPTTCFESKYTSTLASISPKPYTKRTAHQTSTLGLALVSCGRDSKAPIRGMSLLNR